MRRFFAFLTALLFVFLIPSCGSAQVGEDTTEVTAPPFPDLTVCGVDISEFSIVCSSTAEFEARKLASQLADHISDSFGVQLPVTDDSGEAPKHSIFIGRSKHVSDTLRVSAITLEGYKLNQANSMMYTGEGHLWVICSGPYNSKAAVSRLISDITPDDGKSLKMLEWGCDDARTVADSTSKSDTYSGGSIIDYCFVSKDDFAVTSFRVGKGYAGSDHYPVFVRSHLIKK